MPFQEPVHHRTLRQTKSMACVPCFVSTYWPPDQRHQDHYNLLEIWLTGLLPVWAPQLWLHCEATCHWNISLPEKTWCPRVASDLKTLGASFPMLHVNLKLHFPLLWWETPGKYLLKGPSDTCRNFFFFFCREIKASIILSLLLLCKVNNVFVSSENKLACDETDSWSVWGSLRKNFSLMFIPCLNVLCQETFLSLRTVTVYSLDIV